MHLFASLDAVTAVWPILALFAGVGTGSGVPGPVARSLLELGGHALDFVTISEGLGVPASRTTTAAGFAKALRQVLAEAGPHLIHAVLPRRGP